MAHSKYQKIAIVGISGTGKSTTGRKLSQTTGLPLYHIDSLIWKENWKESSADEVEKALTRIAQTDGWIVEGWLDEYSKPVLERADLVIYLDYPGWDAMRGGLQRWWCHRGSKRPELPNGCYESLSLKYLWVMLRRRERPHIERLLAHFNPQKIVRTSSRRQTKVQLSELYRS